MPRPFFVLMSRPRCGSSALCQALNAHRDVTCLFEPPFEMTAGRVPAVRARVADLRRQASGFKHVWEHAGPPFWPRALSVPALRANVAKVRAANRAIAGAPGARVITLHRRDHWARAVSYLVSQQTDLWGMTQRDGRWEFEEPAAFRAALCARPIAPIDLALLDWYLTDGVAEEQRLREDAARANPCLDLAYEDATSWRSSACRRTGPPGMRPRCGACSRLTGS